MEEDKIITADEWKLLSAESRTKINLLFMENEALTASLSHSEKVIKNLREKITTLEIDNDVMRASMGNMIDIY